jgi:hypothetical protein
MDKAKATKALSVAAFCVLALADIELAHAQTANYHWTISASNTDPFVHSASFAPGVGYAYLWLVSCDVPPPLQHGIAAAEFAIVSHDVLHLATTPLSGFLNAGSSSELLLWVSECPCGPLLAAELLLLVQTVEEGTICITSSQNGVLGVLDCSQDPQLWPMSATGLTINGPPPEENCANSGGCCFPDGSCMFVDSQPECAALGGTFLGAGSDCSAPCPPGGCCFADGTCMETATQGECEALSGIFRGVGSDCSPPCSTGACCLPGGSCVPAFDALACDALGGSFRGLGSSCAFGCPQPGAGIGWTISGSSVSPSQTSVILHPFEVSTVYLWLVCADYADGTQGISAAEFDVVSSSPSLVHLATMPVNGFLNAGSVGKLLLAVGGCPSGSVVAAEFLVYSPDGQPATICFQPSAKGIKGTVDCDSPFELRDFAWIGLAVNGGGPCMKGTLCQGTPITLESRSWGSIKALYR